MTGCTQETDTHEKNVGRKKIRFTSKRKKKSVGTKIMDSKKGSEHIAQTLFSSLQNSKIL